MLKLNGNSIIFDDNTSQDVAAVTSKNINNLSSFIKIENIIYCSQSDYDNLDVKDPNTLYIIT